LNSAATINLLDYKQVRQVEESKGTNSKWAPPEKDLDSNKYTIKAILKEIHKDVEEAERFNYTLAKTHFDATQKAKQSAKYTYSRPADQNVESASNQNKEENLYLYYANLGKQVMTKQSSKGASFKGSKILQGVYSPKLDAPSFQFSKTRSMVDLKRGKIPVGGRAFQEEMDNQVFMSHVNDILKSRQGTRKFNRSSMSNLPTVNLTDTITEGRDSQRIMHYPTRRLEQNKMMFNEIFVKPKVEQLKKLEYQREQEFKRLKLPQLRQLTQSTPKDTEPEETDFVRDTLVKERQDKLKEANKDERSLDISSLMERRRFNKNTDNLFGDDEEEEAFRKIDRADFDAFKTEDFEKLRHKSDGKKQYEFQNYLIQSTEDHEEEEENDIIRIIMKKFNSKAKAKAVGSFFTQQIQVQPPEGLINIIGSEGSWAPSIPLTNTSVNKTMFKGKSKDKGLNDTSLQDIKMRAKAGVQAGDVKKEAHMAFCLGSLNEDKNIHKSIRYYKRFFFCARILEDPVGAALALNRLGVAYHKLRNYEKSLMFHMKHKEYTDKENLFAAYYNLGITQRLLKCYDESVQSFSKALEWASVHQELDSECFCNGQLGITELIRRNQEVSSKHFHICLDIAKMLKNTRLQLD
jgi:tetratricopeptide (TPR) repeat protein